MPEPLVNTAALGRTNPRRASLFQHFPQRASGQLVQRDPSARRKGALHKINYREHALLISNGQRNFKRIKNRRDPAEKRKAGRDFSEIQKEALDRINSMYSSVL